MFQRTFPRLGLLGFWLVAGCSGAGDDAPALGTVSQGLAPVNAVPAAQTTNEDSPLFFSGLAGNALVVSDPDNATLTVQITVTNGTFTLGSTNGVTVSGNGTNNVIVTGAWDNGALNVALSNARFMPAPNFSGAATLTINTSDNQGEVDQDTVGITVTAFNDPPVNVLPTAVQAATEDVPRVFNGISVTDVDVGNNPLRITLVASNSTVLTLATLTGLTFTVGDGTDDATVTFEGDLPSVNSALNGFTVATTPNFIGASTVTLTAEDQDIDVPGIDTDTLSINWAAVNDPPVNDTPDPQSTPEETAITFSPTNGNALALADVDALVSLVQVTLSGTSGTVTLGNPSLVTFTTGDGTNDATMTFRATVTNASNALVGTVFTPATDFVGTATVTLLTNDLGNSGSGGARTDSDAVTVTVTPVNDPPVNAVPGAQATNEDVNRVFSTTNGNAITVADVDAAVLEVTLTAVNGVLTLPVRTSLVFSVGDGTADATMTFTGPKAAINAALNGLVFAPTPNFGGAGSLTILTSDQGATGTGGTRTDSDTIAITINPINDPPAATDDVGTVAEDGGPLLVSVLTNDSSAPDTAETLTVSGVTASSNGTATTDGSTVSYTPSPNFYGTDTVFYTLSDGNGGTATGAIVVTVTPVNDPPTAADDTFTVEQDSSTNPLAVRTNDTSAPDGSETLLVTAVGTATSGTASVAPGGVGVIYTPAPGFTGTATFTYTLSDGNGGTDDGTVTVNVVSGIVPPTNQLPATQTIVEDSPLVLNVGAANFISVSDPDSAPAADILTVQISVVGGTFDLISTAGLTTVTGDNTANVRITGTLNALNAALDDARFNPTLNFSGTATLTVSTTDRDGTSDLDVVSIVVTPFNDPPVNTAPTTAQAATEDVPRTFATISINDVDIGDSELLVTLAATNSTLITLADSSALRFVTGDGAGDATMTFRGTLPAINAALNGITITPPLNYLGSSTLTITSNDQGATGAGVAGQDSDVFTINWGAANDAPVNSVVPLASVDEDGTITFAATSGNAISISDIDAGAALMRVTFSVNQGNLTLGNPSLVTFVTGDGLADTTMTFTGSIANINAALDGVVYAAPADFTGTATITLNTSDQGSTGTGGVRTDIDTITVTVVPVNDAPVVTAPAAQTVNEDSVLVFSTARTNLFTVTDIDATSVQVTLSATEGTLSLATTAGLTFAAGTGTANATMTFTGTLTAVRAAIDGLRFTPTPNFFGAASVTFLANDLGATGAGGALTDQDSVAITVSPVNDPPTAVDDTLAITEDDAAASALVLDNDLIAPDVGETLTITAVGTAANGVVSTDGTRVVYQVDPDFVGTDTFTYTIADGNGGTDTGTVTVTVAGVNDPPVAVDDALTVLQDTTANALSVLGNDTAAPDLGETLTITAVGTATNGVVSITTGGGSLTYTPTLGYVGSDTFTYTISDGNGGTATATVLVTVQNVDTMPVASDDTLTVDEDGSGAVTVLTNDSGLGDGPVVVTVSGAPSSGTAVAQADNTIVYTPAANFHGTATFNYTVTDADGDADTATVVVTVAPVNDTPTGADDSITTDEDVEVSIPVTANDVGAVDLPLTVAVTIDPASGTAVAQTDGTVTYTPDPDFNGTDTFTYTVTDLDGEVATAMVTVTVDPVNDPPVAVDDTAATDTAAVSFDVLTNDTDVENDPLTVTGVTDPANGTVVQGTGGSLTYTPDANFTGTDTFDYTVSDGAGGEDTGTVTVTVGIDTDGDGLTDLQEAIAQTDPTLADSDGDQLSDGIEVNQADTLPLDKDSDNDGLSDGAEDANRNGTVDSGETDPNAVDTDGDGVQDGTELGVTLGTTDTDSAVFVPDADPASTTSATTADTDGGTVDDGAEDANGNGRVDAGETDPNVAADDLTTPDGGAGAGGGAGADGGAGAAGAAGAAGSAGAAGAAGAAGGAGTGGAAGAGGAAGGAGGAGGAGTGGTGLGRFNGGDEGGCGCEAPGSRGNAHVLVLGGALVLGSLARRRRRAA